MIKLFEEGGAHLGSDFNLDRICSNFYQKYFNFNYPNIDFFFSLVTYLKEKPYVFP